MWKTIFVLISLVYIVLSMPQAPADERPDPYEYQFEVKDPEKELFFDKNEVGDASGKITGRYSVWLPDGRLMTVDYSIDGESGFQPKVSFQDNANPLG